jgi:hypothetical protein
MAGGGRPSIRGGAVGEAVERRRGQRMGGAGWGKNPGDPCACDPVLIRTGPPKTALVALAPPHNRHRRLRNIALGNPA